MPIDPIRLVLPLPPSINHYWRRVGHRTLISAEGRRYKASVHAAALVHRLRPMDGELRLSGVVYMARRGCDLDNRIKPLLDALNGWAWTDDRQIGRLDLERAVDPKNPRVEIAVHPIPPPSAACSAPPGSASAGRCHASRGKPA